MQINPTNHQNSSLNIYKQNISDQKNSQKANEQNINGTVEESAVSVSISVNTQIVLFSLNTSDNTRDNTLIQGSLTGNKDMFNYLSGKEDSNGFSLKDIGYEGKAITELSSDEANELLSEKGFFGVNQTSNRVSNFVFNFANKNIELLQEGREGIVRGFEEAQKLFGGQLPEISFQTQERTLKLIDEKIESLKNSE